MTVAMTPIHWQAATGIAHELSATNTDVNELKKVVAYLSWCQRRRGAADTEQLLIYLDTLAAHGEVRSNQTPHYYRAIQQACRIHLQPLALQGDELLQVLGWAGRLHQRRSR
ncbi:MAG: hypothetical protein AAF329_21270 [Cyanobacteria bacterium P01_A01_bin.17]